MQFGKNTGPLLIAFLLGLFPAFALPTLQGILWIVIITIGLSFRQIERALFQNALNFCNLAFAQFAIFFLLTAFAIGGLMFVNSSFGGLLSSRMADFTNVEFTYESISAKFIRLKIWDGALTIIWENLWFGIGQVNERFAIRQELEWERWLYSHQTYLSYLIAGGIPALISGLFMQSPVLAFLKSTRRSTMLPAFLGLGVAVTMNCFTDSIFNSAANVQMFMVATLIFLRASDAD